MKYPAHIVLISFLIAFGLSSGAADASGRVGPSEGFRTTATEGANRGFVGYQDRDANAVVPSGLANGDNEGIGTISRGMTDIAHAATAAGGATKKLKDASHILAA
jgi:hypothetical protein